MTPRLIETDIVASLSRDRLVILIGLLERFLMAVEPSMTGGGLGTSVQCQTDSKLTPVGNFFRIIDRGVTITVQL